MVNVPFQNWHKNISVAEKQIYMKTDYIIL